MKKVILFFSFLSILQLSNAQTFPQGSKSISVGYGAGSLTNFILKSVADNLNYKPSSFGPLFLKGEYAVADNFTVGMNINFTRVNATFNVDSVQYTGSIKYRSTSVILRANYTIPIASDKGGVYFGAGIGYRGIHFGYNDDSPYTPVGGGLTIPIPFTVEGTVGIKYYFTENIGVYAETGITRSIIQAGITTRF